MWYFSGTFAFVPWSVGTGHKTSRCVLDCESRVDSGGGGEGVSIYPVAWERTAAGVYLSRAGSLVLLRLFWQSVKDSTDSELRSRDSEYNHRYCVTPARAELELRFVCKHSSGLARPGWRFIALSHLRASSLWAPVECLGFVRLCGCCFGHFAAVLTLWASRGDSETPSIAASTKTAALFLAGATPRSWDWGKVGRGVGGVRSAGICARSRDNER